MIRGTTIQFKFTIPYELKELNFAEVTFWQDHNVGTQLRPFPIIKIIDLTKYAQSTDKELFVILTQEETLRFSDKEKAYVQFRGITSGGIAFASRQTSFTVYPIYGEPMIEDIVTPTGDGVINIDSGVVADEEDSLGG